MKPNGDRPLSSAGPTPVAADFAERVKSRDRAALARAITIVESARAEHERLAEDLLQQILPATGNAVRLGISGAPGAGKSTLIDQLGINLVEAGLRLAVLAVDPSSQRSGGSILGDKTRMVRLAACDAAFIRPSPASGNVGGIAARSREALLLCEASGYDVVIVETVGTGQTEAAVADMVDTFIMLVPPGGGDELQGLKRGALERADIVVVTKADGELAAPAHRAAADLTAAVHILEPSSADWRPPVLTVSAYENSGLDVLWSEVQRHGALMRRTGAFERRRQDQRVHWLGELLQERMLAALRAKPGMAGRLSQLEAAVRRGELSPRLAAERALAAQEHS